MISYSKFQIGFGQTKIGGDPVLPDKTLFRFASVTKTFTAVAVMQQVEAGKLSLDADVNDYLPKKAKIPNTFKEKILVKDLMTHTAGFDER